MIVVPGAPDELRASLGSAPYTRQHVDLIKRMTSNEDDKSKEIK
jgi:hypothetical protein